MGGLVACALCYADGMGRGIGLFSTMMARCEAFLYYDDGNDGMA